jgi:hypothetical protein
MQAAFPAPPEATLGTPTLFVLNDLLQYMCKCAQTHKSTISKKMNVLYVAVNPNLYKHYAGNKAYLVDCYPFPADVPDVPNYASSIDSNIRAARKCTHGMALKKRNNIINMTAALIDAFLDLIPIAFKQAYEQKRMEDPNAIFHEMFDWFVFKYGRTSAEDREANRTVMASEWHPSMGLSCLSRAYSTGPPLQTSQSTPSMRTISLTSASASSIKRASSQRSTRLGFSTATMPRRRTTSLPFVPFGQMQ